MSAQETHRRDASNTAAPAPVRAPARANLGWKLVLALVIVAVLSYVVYLQSH
jgi:hypothetical protein